MEMTSRSALVLGREVPQVTLPGRSGGRDGRVIRVTNMTPLKHDCQPKLKRAERLALVSGC